MRIDSSLPRRGSEILESCFNTTSELSVRSQSTAALAI